ncbi:MAG TPA: hypothetical protein VL970_13775 [Candidatus Acidoferrales bacterium]|nr:hypothetical protein [Candidatus Acidoferrales bacterium]
MTDTRIHALWMVGAGTVALTVLPQQALAVPIVGSISFNGNVTPYVDSTGTGTVATDYSTAHSLVFGETFVAVGADGSFASVPQNSQVFVYSPLIINPPSLPVPSTAPLWSTSVGGFTFTLTLLTEDVLVSPFDTLTLRGTGVISDGNPADSNTGTWVATFTTAQSQDGETFSWNSSSKGNIPGVPDGGASFILLGLGLVSVRAFSFFRKVT